MWVSVATQASGERTLELEVPEGTEAALQLGNCTDAHIMVNGQSVTASLEESRLNLSGILPGRHQIVYRTPSASLVNGGQSA